MMIDSFRGEHRFLSNFHPSPLVYKGLRFETVEHAYQWAKSDSPIDRDSIRRASTPGKAKKIGRNTPMVVNWDMNKYNIMLDLVRQKFSNRELALQLLSTGDEELVEGNNWGDTYWGVYRGVGFNNLGKILMQVRSELRA